MATRRVLRNKIDDKDAESVLAMYRDGIGAATIARVLGFKIYCVEQFLRSSGLMRERKFAASLAMKRLVEEQRKQAP